MNSPIKSSRFSFFSIAALLTIVLLTACSDFFEPVESTSEPTEYGFNYWLLQETYLYEDELPQLDAQGDSVAELYEALEDPFTRYIPPSKSEETSSHINTSIVQGDIGLEYSLYPGAEHPLVISRVYPGSPADMAKVPRYGTILEINGVDIVGENAYSTYDSILNVNKAIDLKIAYQGDSLHYEMEKADIYAPTVFVDSMNGIEIITIRGFKPSTIDTKNGTLGELKAHLDSTQSTNSARLIDLRGNPGGHVNQCIAMADLFIKEGIISSRKWRSFEPDGESVYRNETEYAQSGDAGEEKKFIVLINKGSASCAEIFAVALQEEAGIPVAGETSYGKGIGQSTWNTPAGGLAIITNLEFLTPKGNSYHKKGIVPDFPCETASLQCGFDAIQNYYGKTKQKSIGFHINELPVLRKEKALIGALLQGN